MKFPDPRLAGAEGLVAYGGELSLENILQAYRQGIFPWPEQGQPVYWISPDPRGVLYFEKFKVPRSTTRAIKRENFRVTLNQDFKSVIEACSQVPRPGQKGTWITDEMYDAYIQLHQDGFAMSWEVWQEERLVGGLYGICVEGVFSGESMFHHVTEASKVCLAQVVEDLEKRGHRWMDIQMVTPVLAQMGGEWMPRDQFLDTLKARQKQYALEKSS